MDGPRGKRGKGGELKSQEVKRYAEIEVEGPTLAGFGAANAESRGAAQAAPARFLFLTPVS